MRVVVVEPCVGAPWSSEDVAVVACLAVAGSLRESLDRQGRAESVLSCSLRIFQSVKPSVCKQRHPLFINRFGNVFEC